jgi:citrate synthase
MSTRKSIRTDIAFSTPSTITVKGFDLCKDILGTLSLGDIAFLELTDRLPTTRESVVFNAIAVTYTGAPEAMQAAVAAGLCGLGSVFVGSMETAARMLQEALPDSAKKADFDHLARDIVARFHGRKQAVPGIGHPLHKPVDPRAPRLFQIAAENGFDGPYIKLMKQVAKEAEAVYGRPLPINATGAIAAIASELKLPWKIVRGIGVMARAIGLVGHILEEMREPMAREIKTRAEEEATAHLRKA